VQTVGELLLLGESARLGDEGGAVIPPHPFSFVWIIPAGAVDDRAE
jgi:hypothetical protein